MLHLTLYRYSDAIRRVNKSLYLTGGTALTGDEVMPNQSLSDLSVIISNSGSPTYNYCYIQEFNRYYFITNVSWLGGVGYQLDMHVDVLQTYYNKFTSMNALIEYSTLGSALEYDPRLNYVDQPAITYNTGLPYPQFILGESQYTQAPMVAVRYYDLPIYDPNMLNYDQPQVYCAVMDIITFQRVIEYYLNSNVMTEAKRVEFGSKIIDVNLVYYINEYRMSQGTLRTQEWTIHTPAHPTGITLPITGSGKYMYIIDSYLNLSNIDKAIVNGPNITAANNWTLAGKYTTKLPFIGELSITPSKLGIKEITQLYYVIAVDLIGMQYVITLTDKIDGSGNVYYDQIQRVPIKMNYPFPVDVSMENAGISRLVNVLQGMQNVATYMQGGGGVIGGTAQMFGTYLKDEQIKLADAMSYKYTGASGGMPEYTPADTRRIVQITAIVPPDTNYNSYWSAYGKPDHEMRYLSALSGYAKIEQIHMRYMDTATKEEIDEVEILLKGGVIF